MEDGLAFRRVLLKMSGEMMRGDAPHGIAPEAVVRCALRIKGAMDLGVQLALVIGAGNIFRGQSASRKGMDRSCADQMGMLATVMNALAMRDALDSLGVKAEIQSAIPMTGVVAPFDYHKANALLEEGRVVLFAGGTGHPYFTTDTTAALRACEVGADAVLKGTKVDGVYSADPLLHPDAVRYERLTFSEALAKRLQVMDATAFSLCQDNELPIVIFNFSMPDMLANVLHGDFGKATLVSGDDGTSR
ncbi:MAG: UMP kinase [Lentisphaeria bacterium]|nr:UMP kinase [Lentisphaeria bacterium]